jgi:hypothetical protein
LTPWCHWVKNDLFRVCERLPDPQQSNLFQVPWKLIS